MNEFTKLNGKLYIFSRVVMLPTQKPSSLWLSPENKLFYNPEELFCENDAFQNQFLYFLTRQVIKGGDWCMNNSFDMLYRANKKEDTSTWNKVIATINKDLILNPNGSYLPEPSLHFMREYVRSYNLENPIINVLTEYERYWKIMYKTKPYNIQESIERVRLISRVKLDVNGKVLVKRIKNKWTREEVEALCRKALNTILYNETPEDWLEQNL